MAITQYSELVTAIQNWAARTDSTISNRVDEFITLAEDRLFYGDNSIVDAKGNPLEPLRVRAMETTEDLTINSQSTALPTGFLSHRSLYLDTSEKGDLPYFPPDRFWQSGAAQSTTGEPQIYTIEGDNIVVAPSPDTPYTGKLLCYKKLTGLSSGNTTNWLITNSPGTYLAATMLELSEFTMDVEQIGYWSKKVVGRVNALNRQDTESRYGNDLSVKVDRAAPHINKYVYRSR